MKRYYKIRAQYLVQVEYGVAASSEEEACDKVATYGQKEQLESFHGTTISVDETETPLEILWSE